MTAKHSIRYAAIALGLLLVTVLLALALPAQAAPPEETALTSPWFPETISAGGLHSCALRTDGTLACWGRNDDGQATPPAGDLQPGQLRRVSYLRA